MVIGQRSKRAVEVVRSVGIGRDDLRPQFSPRRLELLQLGRCFRVAQVGQNADPGCPRHDLSRKLHLLGGQSLHVGRNPGHIAPRPRLARDQPQMHGIGERGGHDRDRGRCRLRRHRGTAGGREDRAGAELDQLLCKRRQSLDVAVGESVHDVEIAPFDVTIFPHALQKRLDENPGGCSLAQRKPGDERPLRRRLGEHRMRPSRRAAEQRDELAPPHSITSSASASSRSGTFRPSVLAVLRLMTSSNLVGCWTGNSAGLAPLRMRST